MGQVGFGAGKNDGKKKKRQRITRTRVKLYAQLLLKNPNLSKKAAALKVGFSEAMASNAKSRIEDVHREYFQRLVDAAIPNEVLVLKLNEGLNATVVKTAAVNGKISDMQEFADFDTRLKYIETAAEWKGLVQRRGAGANTQVNLPIMLVHSIPRPDYGNGSDQNGS